ncbi:MAG TPA: choice-of-anchor tandem repeat GloVer-containing protein [Bacteroidia bacterium]|jgi:uncharacterized repeat protein (TIGR03803 family)|nr:choice-of-anchor tandem repeat GloVer-containing protein [Bacteroidia bacterium]
MKRSFIIVLFFYFLLHNNNCVTAQTVGPFYGMTYFGGAYGDGELFSYDPLFSKDSVAISFQYSLDCSHPNGNIIQDTTGILYGLTSGGGINNTGTLFSYNAQTGKDSVLVSFTGNNGLFPMGNLLRGKNGLLYGMTSTGGTNNLGTLFNFNTSTGSQTVLYNFDSAHGIIPNGSLIQDTNGLLYGLASAGGQYKLGTLFCFNPNTLTDTVLVNFNDTNGSTPMGNVIILPKHMLYGMTLKGGLLNAGVAFSYNLTTGKDSTLFSFGSNYFFPYGSFLLASDSSLYGMASNGSTYNGAIFRYNPKTGQDTALTFFTGPNGKSPFGSLMQASDGHFYGMTYFGGSNGYGVLFSFNPLTWKDSVLVNFNSSNGQNPSGDLTEIMYASVAATDSIRCYGDSNTTAKVNVRGAKMPVSYLWSNGNTTDSVSGLKGGIYFCNITDARGVTITVYDTVKQPAQILPNLAVTNGCFGGYGIAQVNPLGGTGKLTYIWNNKDTTATIDSLLPGNDTCIITDSRGCTIKAIAKIQTAQPLEIDSIVSTKTGCPGCSNGSVTVYVSGGIPPGDTNSYLYNWGTGFDSSATNSSKSTMSNLDTGLYYVCIVSTYGCTNGGVCDSIQVLAGIQTIADINTEVEIYPVPSSGVILVILNGDGYEDMEIYDEFGRGIFHQSLSTQTYNKRIQVDMSEYSNGVYILRLLNEKGAVTKKIVLQK